MNEILDHPIQQGSAALSNRGSDIVFRNVGFAYNTGETVLKDISFTAKQGQVTALVGPSGGGKTTVSRLAARFWDVDKGQITVGGMDVSQVDPETLLSLYSIVFQDVTLFDNTILENIRIGRKDATDEEVLAAGRLANCHQFAEALPDGWHSRIGENGCELSGGERQRISIARAFLKDAPIILLDEATASSGRGERDPDPVGPVPADSEQDRSGHRPPDAHRSGGGQNRGPGSGHGGRAGLPADLLRAGGLYAHMVQLQNQSQNWALE